jgi:hypothetical protein
MEHNVAAAGIDFSQNEAEEAAQKKIRDSDLTAHPKMSEMGLGRVKRP